MADTLLFSLTLTEAPEGGRCNPEELEAFIAGLVADLNEIEAVRAAPARSEAMEPGSKGLGPWLLGVLFAEVNGENALLLVVRTVLNFLQERGVPLNVPLNVPIKLGLSRKGADGAEPAPPAPDAPISPVIKVKLSIKRPDGVEQLLELEGSAQDQQVLEALLLQAGACLQTLAGS
ncbi:MAG: hypothetical protein VKK97_00940 [Synechococcaceae cyanobacterium]|nr:hypothetical protein [Synechococcaceae cyanobacterium]